MKIAVLGSGVVGETLANGFLKHGYEVMRGSREPAKMADWQKKSGGKAKVGTFEESAIFGEVIVLAVKGTAAGNAIDLCGTKNLEGKTILDATNPIAEKPPVNGVLQFFTGPNESLMELLQKRVPKANFVKAFSCVGNAFFVNPSFKQGVPTMFICGQNDTSKNQAREILKTFGWDTEDLGAVEAARAIEPLCMLWCIPGLRSNKWNHAFKLLKTGEVAN